MSSHYFDPEPQARSSPGTAELALSDLHLRLQTDRGVFSAERVDPGTRVLLESAPAPPASGRLLDLGCGYGPIALTLGHRSPGAQVVGVDTNGRAVELARTNARSHGLANVECVAVDPGGGGLRADPPGAGLVSGPFDALWSNPPVRIGKAALHALLRVWLARLAPRASAHLVVHRHLGSDSLQAWLRSEGYDCRRLISRSGYRVLEVEAR